MRNSPDGVADCADVGRSCSATSTYNVDAAAFGKAAEDHGDFVRSFIVAAGSIRQSGAGMTADGNLGKPGESFDVRHHVTRALTAVDADREKFRVRNGIPEILQGFIGENPSVSLDCDGK